MQALIDVTQRRAAFKQAFPVRIPAKLVGARCARHRCREFTDHFLNDVFQRDQSLHFAVFINNDGEPFMVFLEILQL